KIKKGMQRYKGGHSFTLLLSDQTGNTVDYKYWGPEDEEKVRKLYDSIPADSVLHIQARMNTYNGKLQMAASEPLTAEALKPGQFDVDAFVKPAKKDINKMFDGLKEAIGFVSDPNIKLLLTKIFTDSEIEAKFRKHPGAISIHHNWTGGLLQHTLEVLNYCILSHKQFPELNKDLLIAGALLHDIGKLEEIEVTTRIKGSEKGQLIGHLPLGMLFVSKKMDEIDSFDNDLKNKILHMLASHHGRLEYGTPKEPMIPEAIALYYADEMSSKIAEFTELVSESKSKTEDSFMYSPRHARNIFLR
ncbi:MAG: HD domain-containing protein, partial [Candidatus Woesearchaeota archaeon]|nr:HD domain-containing protein [Candidatus Woesearchaeota archaeon]